MNELRLLQKTAGRVQSNPRDKRRARQGRATPLLFVLTLVTLLSGTAAAEDTPDYPIADRYRIADRNGHHVSHGHSNRVVNPTPYIDANSYPNADRNPDPSARPAIRLLVCHR